MPHTMKLCYQDRRILVALKPSGVRSTDEPGGMPELLREALGDPSACVRTVHRLDQVVGGLMVFARSAVASRELSQQIQAHTFQKKYLAVIHGVPELPAGTFTDLLQRSSQERKTYVVQEPGKGVQWAELDYQVLETTGELSLVEIALKTGRTHQIRVQFSSRGLSLVGDRKYGVQGDGCDIALWSCHLGFFHPESGEWIEFDAPPPGVFPWTAFQRFFQSEVETREILDVVDEQGNPTGAVVERQRAHTLGIPHRTAHVWLLRRRQDRVQILLQMRSLNKDSYPGCYDISSAGHIPAGVDFIPSALRELREELGCTAKPEQLIFCGQRSFEVQCTFHGKPFHDRQVSRIYALWMDREEEEFTLQQEEVSKVRWFDFEECVDLVTQNRIPHCIYLEELKMVEQTILLEHGETES